MAKIYFGECNGQFDQLRRTFGTLAKSQSGDVIVPGWVTERARQMEQYYTLEQCGASAQTIQHLVQEYNLTRNNFSTLTNLINSCVSIFLIIVIAVLRSSQ